MQGWYRQGETFNFNRVYGDGKGRWQGVAWIEEQMTGRAKNPGKITLEDMIWALCTPQLTGETAGYGQVAEAAAILLDQQRPELACQYLDYFTNTELMQALELADNLARSLEAKTWILYGISDESEHRSAHQLW